MRHFLIKVFIFLIPLLLLGALPFIIFLNTGEFYSLSNLEHAQLNASSTIIFNPLYSNFAQLYKIQSTELRQPQVLALGSSRVGPFRSVFFKDPSVFYNASGGAAVVSDFKHFIEDLTYKPDLLIVGMDQYFFNPLNVRDNIVTRPDPYKRTVTQLDVAMEGFFRQGGWWKAYKDFFTKQYTLSDIFTATTSPQTIGAYARPTSVGYIDDGSIYYGNVTGLVQQKNILAQIEGMAAEVSTTSGYEYGDGISQDALKELKAFLSLCKEKNITVIGFIPPVPHAVYERMKEFPTASYQYALKNLGPTLTALYASYRFDFYDFSDSAAYGGSDNEMVEGKHGGEKLYLRLFLQMANHSTSLAPLVDKTYLTTRLTHATSTYHVFGLEER
jgi:hypothetical protein